MATTAPQTATFGTPGLLSPAWLGVAAVRVRLASPVLQPARNYLAANQCFGHPLASGRESPQRLGRHPDMVQAFPVRVNGRERKAFRLFDVSDVLRLPIVLRHGLAVVVCRRRR